MQLLFPARRPSQDATVPLRLSVTVVGCSKEVVIDLGRRRRGRFRLMTWRRLLSIVLRVVRRMSCSIGGCLWLYVYSIGIEIQCQDLGGNGCDVLCDGDGLMFTSLKSSIGFNNISI